MKMFDKNDSEQDLFESVQQLAKQYALECKRDVKVGPFVAPIVVSAFDADGLKRDVKILIDPKNWSKAVAERMANVSKYRREKYRELSGVDFVAIVVPGDGVMPEGITSLGELDTFLEQFSPPCGEFIGTSGLNTSTPSHRDTPVSTHNYEMELANGYLEWSGNSLVFCAMPFSEKFDKVFFELIAPAIDKAGLTVLRTDQEHSLLPINKRIEEGIRNAAFTIADITGLNPNVMYEVGMTHAMGKHALLLKSDDEPQPFDLKYIEFVQYDLDEPKALVDALAEKLSVAHENLWENQF